MRRWRCFPAALLAVASQVCPLHAAEPAPPAEDVLARQFADPPASARPRVWWHWMNGNITEEGIRKDLEWMHRVGIGGVQNFDAAMATPQIVSKRLGFMTPDWQSAFRHAAAQAQTLGLELAIASSPGWSETGGPWVGPADAMKKLVWSETVLKGGMPYRGRLAQPPSITGPYQSLPMHDELAAMEGRAPATPPTLYADVAVLAYPLSAPPAVLPAPRVTAGAGPIDAAALFDDDVSTAIEVPPGTPAQPTSVSLSYPRPVTIRSASVFLPGAVSLFGDAQYSPRLEAKIGTEWRPLGTFDLAAVPTTLSFAAVTAQEFRLVLGPNTAPPRASLGSPAAGVDAGMPFGAGAGAGARTVRIADLRLTDETRVDHFEAKAGFSVARDYFALPRPADDRLAGVEPQQVLDLTGRMQPDGRLDWTPPSGSWRVLRLGYSLIGTTNHPASAEGTGLEVDKYDGAAVARYLTTYLDMYRRAVGGELFGSRGLRALVTDSIEVGPSNWTPALLEQFQRLRGYDPRPWLPSLAGVLVGTRADSDAFLYDFRRTLADLIAIEHYGQVANVAHTQGLIVYGEALEELRPSLGDDMAMRSHTDVPMSAMWTFDRDAAPRPSLLADIKGAASVAHTYGQNLVAAESMTSALHPWGHSPADLKHVIDLEFACGVNRPVIHTSVHQPLDDKVPGLSLAIFGQYFNRHESWAELAKPWIDYLARSSLLLQQGRFFADVAYFYGEEAPLTSLYGDHPIADAPREHAYDFVNSEVLQRLTVEQGTLVAPGGARYRLLYLGGSSRHMTLATLLRLETLVRGGATLAGQPPVSSPSLADNGPAFAAAVQRLWPGGARVQLGEGVVVANASVDEALAALGVSADFSYQGAPAGTEVRFVHRRLPEGDVYFLSNARARAVHLEARFRITGRQAEIWHAEDGSTQRPSYRIDGEHTQVGLDLQPEDAIFVVFRKPGAAAYTAPAPPPAVPVADLDTGWSVSFEPGRGAPAGVELPHLQPLNEHPLPGIRYFSGIATYRRAFTLTGQVRHSPLWLDLGRIGDVAEVSVNGQFIGAAWHAPNRIDIGGAVRPGRNDLQIRVANLWVNRLIGDAQPGAAKVAFTAGPTYRADAPLRPSGLIGPVRLTGERD